MARGFVPIAVPAATVLTLTFRYLLRQELHHMRGRGHFTKRVLLLGSEQASTELLATLTANRYAGLTVVATCLTARMPMLAAGDSRSR